VCLRVKDPQPMSLIKTGESPPCNQHNRGKSREKKEKALGGPILPNLLWDLPWSQGGRELSPVYARFKSCSKLKRETPGKTTGGVRLRNLFLLFIRHSFWGYSSRLNSDKARLGHCAPQGNGTASPRGGFTCGKRRMRDRGGPFPSQRA